MFQHFGKWLGGGNNSSSGNDAEHKLREISLEYDEAELVTATHNFDTGRRLGSGNYGAVYRGTLPDGHDVAIKVMDVDEDDDDGSSGFADEVRVLSKFRHPNLVTLMGWGIGKGRQFLVYELLDGGDVSHRLQSCRASDGEPFGWADRLWVALDAACGLSHMHNSTPKAFHRDIKSANILLDRSGTAKMADFGLSGIAKNKGKLNMTCEQISGTPGYACPHYIKSGRVTEGSEVYAFGMVTLELLLNSMPACLGHGGNIIYPIFQVVMPQAAGAVGRTLKALDPQAAWPPGLAKEMSELALACSALEEASRPNFTDVARRLRQFCEQFCGGKRPHQRGMVHQQSSSAIPQTNPQMGSHLSSGMGAGDRTTRPQLGVSQGAPPDAHQPTRPQLSLSRPAAPGAELMGRSQGSPGAGQATGQPHVAAGAGPGKDVPTRPQMGVVSNAGGACATPVTRPQMGLGQSPDLDQPTRPQLGLGHVPPGSAVQGCPRATPPLALQQVGFAEVVKELWDTGWDLAHEGQAGGGAGAAARSAGLPPPQDVAEAVLECVHSTNAEVASMPLKHKCLVLKAGGSPWTVGRQQQPNFFARIVPDEALRTVISRNHLLLTSERKVLRLKKLSPNAVFLNGQPLQQQELTLASGANIGFCGQDNATAFLSFRVLLPSPALSGGGAAVMQQSQQTPQVPKTDAAPREPPPYAPAKAFPPPVSQQQPAAWWCAGPPTPFSLVCVLAFGCDVASQPLPTRTVGLPADACLTIGRIHQPGFFEGILGAEPAQRYLCCVSRSHLEVAAAGPPGCFDVTNLSVNPVALVGQRRLGKGEKGTVRPGDCIDFIGGSSGGTGSPVVYLKLSVQGAQNAQPPQPAQPAQGVQGVQGAQGAQSTPSAQSSPSGLGVYGQQGPGRPPDMEPEPPPSTTQSHHWKPQMNGAQPIAADSSGLATPSHAGHQPAQPLVAGSLRPLLPVPEELAARSTSARAHIPFWLALRGTAVREAFPQEKRVLEGHVEGLSVGRAHQQTLHSEAFEVELRQYLSRDHFRVEAGGGDGTWRLVPMSSNPIWRVRNGRQLEAVRGDPALPLAHGDAIQLFTGAEDCSPDGPGNLGTLLWVFQDTSSVVSGDSGGAGSARCPERSCVPHALQLTSAPRGRGDVSPKRQAAEHASTPTSSGKSPGKGGQDSSVAGALQAPVRGLPAVDEEHHGLLDVDLSYRDVNDKFAASGFRY